MHGGYGYRRLLSTMAVFYLHCWRQYNSEYKLQEIVVEQSAPVLKPCLRVSSSNLAGHWEDRMLDKMGYWPEQADSPYVLIPYMCFHHH